MVVGINSIINRSLPDGCLAVGAPCKVVKENMYPKKLSDGQITEMIENYYIRLVSVSKSKRCNKNDRYKL